MQAPTHEARNAAMIDGAKDIAFGSAAGMVSKVFEHPFDLCKVRLQSQVLDSTARFTGPIDCLKKTWQKEGVRGLYRGVPAPVVGAMAENATLFLTFGQLQRLCRWIAGSPGDELTTAQFAFSAAGAGAVTSFLLTPIELVKCKMQVQLLALESAAPEVALQKLAASSGGIAAAALTSPPPPSTKPDFRRLPGPLAVLQSTVRAHGLRGLWLGQTGTLIRETGGAVAWFGAKEAVAALLLRRREGTAPQSAAYASSKELRAWESAVAGACAGVAYNVVLFPADSVKSALQTGEELRPLRAGERRPTFWGVAREMWARQGVRGLYAGCGITTARAIPSSAIIFLIYDGLSKKFG